ncbi:unnamed protein product [Closterium sp. NIES-54]
MYRLTKDAEYILLTVYVDDLLYIGSTDGITTWFEGELQQDISLTVSSTITQYLGLNILDGENTIYLSAAKYADTIKKRFGLTPAAISTPYRYTAENHQERYNPLGPAGLRDYQPKQGCLLFTAVTCRPDLSYSASQLSTYLKRPEAEHMAELDRALHYLVSTLAIGLTYHKTATMTLKLISYVDADHAGNFENRRSRTGYIYRVEPGLPIVLQVPARSALALSCPLAQCYATLQLLALPALVHCPTVTRAHAAQEQPLPRAPLLPACSPCPVRPCCLRAAPALRAIAACEQPLPRAPLLPTSSPCPARPYRLRAALAPARPVCRVASAGFAPCCSPHVAPCCPACRALLQPARRALLLRASCPNAARASFSSAPCVAPYCSPRVAPCCPASRALLQPAIPALLPCTACALLPAPPRPSLTVQPEPPSCYYYCCCCCCSCYCCCWWKCCWECWRCRRPAPPSRPAATTPATAARATVAAGGGAARSAGGAAGAGGAGGAAGSTGGAAGAGGAGPTTDRHCVSWQLSRQLQQLGVDSSGHCLSKTTPPLSSFRCVPGSVEAAALGSSESAAAPRAGESTAALGARESADALGASASTATGPASAEALHTFTLDSGASCCFFRDCTTVTPLAALVPVLLADPTGGPVVARASTVLLCPVVPSGMHSLLLVSGLPRSLPSLPRSPTQQCLPCVEGQQRAAPHSSEFPPTTAPLQTLHMDVWGPAPIGGTDQEHYFLLVVDDYTRYTTVFPLRRKADVSGVLIP